MVFLVRVKRKASVPVAVVGKHRALGEHSWVMVTQCTPITLDLWSCHCQRLASMLANLVLVGTCHAGSSWRALSKDSGTHQCSALLPLVQGVPKGLQQLVLAVF